MLETDAPFMMPTGASSERSERCSGMRWSRLSGLFRWCCVVVFCESCLLRSWSLVARPFSSLFVAPASCLQYPCGFSFCLHGFKTGKDTWAALVVVGSFLWFSPLPAATHLNKSYALLVDLVRSVFPRRIALRSVRELAADFVADVQVLEEGTSLQTSSQSSERCCLNLLVVSRVTHR